ncbi:DUF2809 domain-containing protein [Zunongwangia sp. F260]|uniref:DUF2809 domain-containing protein n=1 Tax=Autumnicola lenta TaxID=3075593 RepID=A0ABU3CJ08_9FLAO|nr:DUF2809 domain-containing protein [Zunongwangia sp. F260]MDT0646342.1 DUF2809 domain-containing protein [Zunongwangia sp. F260]
MRINRSSKIAYLVSFVLLLIIEIAIGVWVKDDFVRPYGGDFLVVILIYCFLMTVTKLSVFRALIAVLLFSFAVEFFQLINIVKVLQYQPPKIVMIILGSSFSAWDLVAYSVGILFTGGIEYFRSSMLSKT